MVMEKQIPQFLKEMLLKQYGEEITNKIINGYLKQRLVTLRVNTIKSNKENIKQKLQDAGIETEEIISAVCGEVNQQYRNAEITDCATLPDYRKFKLMQFLITRLEEELRSRRIYCLYSIARANSYGMNAVFHRLYYQYRGRLANNCNIFEDIEDMNVWMKNISL